MRKSGNDRIASWHLWRIGRKVHAKRLRTIALLSLRGKQCKTIVLNRFRAEDSNAQVRQRSNHFMATLANRTQSARQAIEDNRSTRTSRLTV